MRLRLPIFFRMWYYLKFAYICQVDFTKNSDAYYFHKGFRGVENTHALYVIFFKFSVFFKVRVYSLVTPEVIK